MKQSFIAKLTSKRVQIKYPCVRQLADGIVEAQEYEIKEMNGHIKGLENKN